MIIFRGENVPSLFKKAFDQIPFPPGDLQVPFTALLAIAIPILHPDIVIFLHRIIVGIGNRLSNREMAGGIPYYQVFRFFC